MCDRLTQDKFLCHVYAHECHKYPPFHCLHLQLPYRVSEEPTTANGFRSPTPAILLPGEALELLLGAGLDRVQATNLLAGSSGQRPTSQDRGAGQRSSTRSAEEQGSHQSAQGSQFERTVLETLAKFGERLNSLTAKVEGSDSSSSTLGGASQTSEPSSDWGDRDVDERLNDYSAILTWPDKQSGEDPSVRQIISVSESTTIDSRVTLSLSLYYLWHHKDTKICLQKATVQRRPVAGAQSVRFSKCGGHQVPKAGPSY